MDDDGAGMDAMQAKMMEGMRAAKDQAKVAKANLRVRSGEAPTEGFQACQIVVSECTNAGCNGTYLPAVPYDGKPVWHKPPGDVVVEEAPAEGEEAKSKDSGERFLYFSPKVERWFIGDELEEGGFTCVPSCGKCIVPPFKGWQKSAVLEAKAPTADGGINAAVALKELPKLRAIEPWEDQEACYVTMLKVLANIFNNPGEAKFCSLKIENPAIQKKILRHDGARGYFEAVGFREDSGCLILPTDRSGQAKLAHQLLEGFGTEAQYDNIRAERHKKALDEKKKEEANDGWKRPKADKAAGYEDDAGAKGSGKGPQKG